MVSVFTTNVFICTKWFDTKFLQSKFLEFSTRRLKNLQKLWHLKKNYLEVAHVLQYFDSLAP